MDFTLFKNVSLYSVRAKKGNIMKKFAKGHQNTESALNSQYQATVCSSG